MRRSRFVNPVQPRENEKASIREALWFDLRSPETSDDATLSDWRVAGLDRLVHGLVRGPRRLAEPNLQEIRG